MRFALQDRRFTLRILPFHRHNAVRVETTHFVFSLFMDLIHTIIAFRTCSRPCQQCAYEYMFAYIETTSFTYCDKSGVELIESIHIPIHSKLHSFIFAFHSNRNQNGGKRHVLCSTCYSVSLFTID